MTDIKELKKLLRKYESIIAIYIEDYNYQRIKDNSLIFSDKDSNELEITLVDENIKIQKIKDNTSMQVIITLPKEKNDIVKCEETTIEDREHGIILEKVTRVYDYTTFDKEFRYLTDISSRRYVLTGEGYLEYLSSEEKLSEKADLKTEFSSHMRNLIPSAKRFYTDTPFSNRTYLNGVEISRLYDIVDGPNKIEKIYDLYNGRVTEDNTYDLVSINLGLLSSDTYDYKEKIGITQAEDNLVGPRSRSITPKYETTVKKFIKKELKYPHDLDITNRDEFVKALNYKPKAVDVCKSNLERLLGIPYQEFDNLDFDDQQELIKIAREKNRIPGGDTDEVTMMIGSGEHSIFTRVKRGKRILVGSGEHSFFVEAGLTPEEEKRRLDKKIDAILNPKKTTIKEKVKNFIKRI